jgi:hypothetical protein
MSTNSLVYNTSASANPHPTTGVNDQQLVVRHRFSSTRYHPPAQAAPWWEMAQVQRASAKPAKNRKQAPGHAGPSAVARLRQNNTSVARWPSSSSSAPPLDDAVGLRPSSAWQMQLKDPPPARRPFVGKSVPSVVARADPPSLVGKSEDADRPPVPVEVVTTGGPAPSMISGFGTIAGTSSVASYESFDTVPLELPSEQVDAVPLDQVEAEDFEYSDDVCFSDGIFEGLTTEQPTTTEPPSTPTPTTMWTTHDVAMMEAPTAETMSINSVREPAKKKRVEQSAFGRAIAVPTNVYQAASSAIADIARNIMGDCLPVDPPATSQVHSPSRKSPRRSKGSKDD